MSAPAVPATRLPEWSLAGAGILLSAGLAAAVWVAGHVRVDEPLFAVALFAHLGSLVVGFGAVLTVDWVGLLWLLGRRSMANVVEAAGNGQVLIWIGLAGLVVSGVFLDPDVARPLTRFKLSLVLLVTWNGLLATLVHRRLAARGSVAPGRLLLGLALCTAAVSQLGWWGSMLIGFLNH